MLADMARHIDRARSVDGCGPGAADTAGGGASAHAYPEFGIFELPDDRDWVDGGEGWPKITQCKAVFLYGESYRKNEHRRKETLWANHIVPGQHQIIKDALLHHEAWPCKFGRGDWVWAMFNAQSGRWEMLGPYEDHWRFHLTEPLKKCGSVYANLIVWQEEEWRKTELQFLVYDSLGIICAKACQCGDSSSSSSSSGCCECEDGEAPAGSRGFAKYFADSRKFELLSIGEGCPESSSSGSSSDDSSSSGSSSDDSSSSSSSGSSSDDSSSSGGECKSSFGDLSVSDIPVLQYDNTTGVTHLLGLKDGCLVWVPVGSCEEPEEPEEPE